MVLRVPREDANDEGEEDVDALGRRLRPRLEEHHRSGDVGGVPERDVDEARRPVDERLDVGAGVVGEDGGDDLEDALDEGAKGGVEAELGAGEPLLDDLVERGDAVEDPLLGLERDDDVEDLGRVAEEDEGLVADVVRHKRPEEERHLDVHRAPDVGAEELPQKVERPRDVVVPREALGRVGDEPEDAVDDLVSDGERDGVARDVPRARGRDGDGAVGARSFGRFLDLSCVGSGDGLRIDVHLRAVLLRQLEALPLPLEDELEDVESQDAGVADLGGGGDGQLGEGGDHVGDEELACGVEEVGVSNDELVDVDHEGNVADVLDQDSSRPLGPVRGSRFAFGDRQRYSQRQRRGEDVERLADEVSCLGLVGFEEGDVDLDDDLAGRLVLLEEGGDEDVGRVSDGDVVELRRENPVSFGRRQGLETKAHLDVDPAKLDHVLLVLEDEVRARLDDERRHVAELDPERLVVEGAPLGDGDEEGLPDHVVDLVEEGDVDETRFSLAAREGDEEDGVDEDSEGGRLVRFADAVVAEDVARDEAVEDPPFEVDVGAEGDVLGEEAREDRVVGRVVVGVDVDDVEEEVDVLRLPKVVHEDVQNDGVLAELLELELAFRHDSMPPSIRDPPSDELGQGGLAANDPVGLGRDQLRHDGRRVEGQVATGCEARLEQLRRRLRDVRSNRSCVFGREDAAEGPNAAVVVESFEEERRRLLGVVAKELCERVAEGARLELLEVALDLGRELEDVVDVDFGGGMGEEVEDVDDGGHDLDLAVLRGLPRRGSNDVAGDGEVVEVVDELVADLDLEVVRQELEEACEPLQTRERQPLVVGEVHQDGFEPVLEEVPRQLALQQHDALEGEVRRVDDLGRLGVQQLEAYREHLHPDRHVRVLVERRRRHRGGEELDANDAELRERRRRLDRRLRPDEGRVLGVGDPEGLVDEPHELVLELDEGRVEGDAVGDGVDVADLHGEAEGAEGFGEDGGDEAVADGHEEFGEGSARLLGEDGEGLANRRPYAGDLTAELEEEEPDEVVELGLGVGGVGAGGGGAADADDVEEGVGNDVGVRGSLAGHVLEAEEEGASELDLVLEEPLDLDVDLGREDRETVRRARLALPRLLVAEGPEPTAHLVKEDGRGVEPRLRVGVASGEEVLDDLLRLSGRSLEVLRLGAAEVLDDAVDEGGTEGENLLGEGWVLGELLAEFEGEDVLSEVDDVLVRLDLELVDSGRVEEASKDVAERLLRLAAGKSLRSKDASAPFGFELEETDEPP